MYEKIELIISEYKLNRITKEKYLIELRNHIEQIIKQVDTKQLTLTDVSQREQLCYKCNKEKQLQKLTEQAQELGLGYDN